MNKKKNGIGVEKTGRFVLKMGIELSAYLKNHKEKMGSVLSEHLKENVSGVDVYKRANLSKGRKWKTEVG